MRRLLARLRRRTPAPPRGGDDGSRLMRIYRETAAELQEIRRAA